MGAIDRGLYLGETAMDSKIRCFTVAQIQINIDGLGSLKTETGVVNKEPDLHYYILGNKTQKIIKLARQPVTAFTEVNAVITRTQARKDPVSLMVGASEKTQCKWREGIQVVESKYDSEEIVVQRRKGIRTFE